MTGITRYLDLTDFLNKLNKITKNFKYNFTKKIYSFYGTKGKNFLANTRALHRGLAINKNRARLMLELYFSNHLLGKNRKLDLEKNHSSYKLWNKMINENPKLYQGIFTERTINSFLI